MQSFFEFLVSAINHYINGGCIYFERVVMQNISSSFVQGIVIKD